MNELRLDSMITLGRLFDNYMSYARLRLRTCSRIEGTYRRYLAGMSDRDALDLTRADVEELRTRLATSISAKTANTVVELISTMYNRAIQHGLIPGHNPARGLSMLSVPPRARMPEPKEIANVVAALGSLRSDTVREFFAICMLTGEQKGKVLEMTYAQLDLDKGLWLVPQRKRAPRVLYLLPEAVAILSERGSTRVSDWVFQSICAHRSCRGTCALSLSGHLEGVEKSWAALLKRARVKGLRLNDLRNCKHNMEPVRIAFAQHFRPLESVHRLEPQPEVVAARKEWRDQVRKAIAAPVLRPAVAPYLVLTPFDPNTGAATFGSLFDYYMAHHGVYRKSAPKMRAIYNRHLSCFAARPADQITPADVQQLRDFLGEHAGKAAANRALEILSAVYARANKWQLIDLPNPCRGVELFRLKNRERFLTAEENARLAQELDARRDSTVAAYVQVLRFTGARSSNVAAMRWEQIDTESNTWRIPETKNGRSHTVPLLPEALEAIEGQRGKHAVWVFPGRGRSGHIANPQRTFKNIAAAAGIADVRKQDLRRTLGSWQAKTGASLPIIGKTLGHINQSATQIYARLDLEPVRAAMETATKAMTGKSAAAKETRLTLDREQLELLAGLVAERITEKEASASLNLLT